MRLGQKCTLLFLIILFLFCSGPPESSGDSVSQYRFYDTHRMLAAEKELDWRMRQNRSESLRLEFEANRPRFNSSDLRDYPDYLKKSERHWMNLLTKQEDILSASYLSGKAIRDISDGFRTQDRDIKAYHGEKREEYYDYLAQLNRSRKSSQTPFFGFVVGAIVTCLTGGTATPVLLGLQVVKFGADGMIETAYGPGSEGQRAFDFLYGFGTSAFGALQGLESATKLWDSGQKFFGGIQYVQITNGLLHPLTNEFARENPDSFIGRGLPGVMAGLNLVSNFNRLSNMPKGEFLPKNPMLYPASTLKIGSTVSDLMIMDYSLGGKDSWMAKNPDRVFYLQQGCRLFDVGQIKMTEGLERHYLVKGAEKGAEGVIEVGKVKNGGVKVVDYPNEGGEGGHLKYYRDPKEFVGDVKEIIRRRNSDYRGNDPNYLEKITYSVIENLYDRYKEERLSVSDLNSQPNEGVFRYRDIVNYKGRDGMNSVEVTSEFQVLEGIKYLEGYVETNPGKGEGGEFSNGLAKVGHREEAPSLQWGNSLPLRANEIDIISVEGLVLKDKLGNEWKVHMFGIRDNVSGTYKSNGKQGYWKTGRDSHGQILPIGSGILVDEANRNYFVQLSKGFAPIREDLNTSAISRGFRLSDQLNQPAKNFFKDFGSPFLENFTPQTIAQKYDPWLQNYTVYGGGVEQIQDASGRYQTINRLDYSIERLGKVKDINGELQPAMVEGGTIRGGKIGEFTYAQSLKDPVGKVYVHDVRNGKNVIYTPPSSHRDRSLDLYSGEYYRREGWRAKTYRRPLKELYASRQNFLDSARNEMASHIKNTAILRQAEKLTTESVNSRDFDSLKEVKVITRDKLIPTQKTIKDVIKIQSYIDKGNDWSNWEFKDERGNLRDGNEFLTTPQDVAKEENISEGYIMVPWTADFLKNSETKIISNFQIIETGGNLVNERLSLREAVYGRDGVVFALNKLEKIEILNFDDGQIARENIDHVYSNLEEKVKFDHTYHPSENILRLQEIAPVATSLVSYAGVKLCSPGLKVGTGVLQLGQGKIPTGLSALFSTKRAPIIRIFGTRVGRGIYHLYGKAPTQKISYSNLAGGVLGVGAAAVSGYQFGEALGRLLEDGSRKELPNFGLKAAGTLATLGSKSFPPLLLVPPITWGLDCGLERLTDDPTVIDITRELLYDDRFH